MVVLSFFQIREVILMAVGFLLKADVLVGCHPVAIQSLLMVFPSSAHTSAKRSITLTVSILTSLTLHLIADSTNLVS